MASQAESLRGLKYKRGYVKSTLTKFNSFISSLNPEDLDEIQIRTRLPKIKDLWGEFHNIQAQIQCLDDSETEPDSEEVDNFESNYFNAIASAERLLSNYSKISQRNPETKSNASVSAGIQDIQGQIRLPQISLPAFSGTFEEWIPFFDTFSSLIHTNEALSEIQKFHYLKSCVKCEAANCIQELPISKQNYAIAWATLKDRYDNKRLIIRKHIQSIHELPVCAHENGVTLRQIIDGVQKHTRALNSLGRPTEQWDDWLTYLISNKLDRISNKEWESSLKANHIPTAKELLEFLSHKCNALEAISKGSASVYATVNKVNKYQKSSLACISNQSSQCVICKSNHAIYNCADFLKLSVEQRLKEVKRCKLCNNCLRSGHFSSKCISGHCRKCPQKHNTLLHMNKAVPEQSLQPADQSSASTSVSESIVAHSIRYPRPTHVLLATAVVEVRDQGQEFHKCRAVLDSGSQSNFISRSFAEKLGLKFDTVNIPLCGIGQTHSRISKAVSARIKSQYNAFSCELSCLVIDQITNNIPVSTLSKGTIDIPRKLSLADPEFHVSRKVDMLIGAELFWQLLCVGQAKLPNTNVIMQKTQLGWIISGSIVASSRKLCNAKSCNILVDQSLDSTLRRFWELEEFSITNGYSSEEIACERHFTETHKRDQTGRFVVKLPFKINPHTLGDSKDLAINRFHSLERRFAKQPLLKQQYDEFIDEYIRLGHMKVINDNGDSQNAFYLPHHAVVKGHSLTTKLRVVFDASAKTTSGKSLNDILLTGPSIQQDLFSIVCRFRTHKIVLTADVAKMYRQVLVDNEDAKWQRFIWRFHPNEPLKTYELKTVTYGTAPASFLATRALKQVALEGACRFPVGSAIALRDFYVDDLLTGADTMTDIETIFKEIDSLLMEGGFPLRKWASNDSQVLNKLLPDASEPTILNLDKDSKIKALGLQWDSALDALQYTSLQDDGEKRSCKRALLSQIAQIFDPLGLIGPITVRAKMLIQVLWQLKISWDESLPLHLHTQWRQYQASLGKLDSIKVRRNAVPFKNTIELHGFCDASEKAYGACLYVRCYNGQDELSAQLLCSKSRVAPLKFTTIPRLELCAALLLARLIDKVRQTIDLNISEVYYWTDSAITLAWIRTTARQLKTFVANRVAEIQELTEASQWHHVGTRDNPADLLSRGVSPEELAESRIWWHGPAWLVKGFEGHLVSTRTCEEIEVPEKRDAAVISAIALHDMRLFERYSSFPKLQRVFSYCLRFCHNVRSRSVNSKQELRTGRLTVDELHNATKGLARLVQQESFPEDLQ